MLLRLLATLLLVTQFSPLMAETDVFIMLGAPGAGKGTQAIRLSEATELPHISVGDLYRDNIRRETALGLEAKSFVESGQLAPDSLTIRLLADRLKQEDCAGGYILDGFPRTLGQAEAFDKQLGEDARIRVISLQVPDEKIAERITGRLSCGSCKALYHKTNHPPAQEGLCDVCGSELIQRKDDTLEVVTQRLRIFHEETAPVEAFYRERGLVIDIDACQDLDVVFQTILEKTS